MGFSGGLRAWLGGSLWQGIGVLVALALGVAGLVQANKAQKTAEQSLTASKATQAATLQVEEGLAPNAELPDPSGHGTNLPLEDLQRWWPDGPWISEEVSVSNYGPLPVNSVSVHLSYTREGSTQNYVVPIGSLRGCQRIRVGALDDFYHSVEGLQAQWATAPRVYFRDATGQLWSRAAGEALRLEPQEPPMTPGTTPGYFVHDNGEQRVC